MLRGLQSSFSSHRLSRADFRSFASFPFRRHFHQQAIAHHGLVEPSTSNVRAFEGALSILGDDQLSSSFGPMPQRVDSLPRPRPTDTRWNSTSYRSRTHAGRWRRTFGIEGGRKNSSVRRPSFKSTSLSLRFAFAFALV